MMVRGIERRREYLTRVTTEKVPPYASKAPKKISAEGHRCFKTWNRHVDDYSTLMKRLFHGWLSNEGAEQKLHGTVVGGW